MPTRKSTEESLEWDRFSIALLRRDGEDVRRIARQRGDALAVVIREAVAFWLAAQQKRKAS